MDECKPLPSDAPPPRTRAAAAPPRARGLHSSTFQLNLSALYGIGVARRDFVARVQGVLGVFMVFMVCRVLLCVRHGSN